MQRKRQRGGSDTHTAVLIEPRKSMQKAVEFVIGNVLMNLSKNWNLMIFPGEENIGEVRSFVDSLPSEDKSRVTIKDLKLTTMDMKKYNELMMSRRILDEIPTEVFLVIQTDSIICEGGKDILQKFINKGYDYVGAPWKDFNDLGNGGFSLRRKSMMLKVLEKCSKKTKEGSDHNEDGFFSGGCDEARPKKPSPQEAEEFSVETIYNGKQPFGIHKAWDHISDKSGDLEKKCIGYDTIRKLNSQKGGSTLFKDAYAITMNPESNRYKQTEASAKAAGLTLHKWDAVKVDESMKNSLMEQGIGSLIFKGNKMRFKGAIGCFLAHRGLMRHIAEHPSPAEGTLILEDDVSIPPDFNERFNAVIAELPKDWDILYMDKVNPKSEKISEHIHKFQKQMTTDHNWGNWAYIVRHKSLKRILALLEFMIDPVDIQLHKFADKLNIYLAIPSLITLNKDTTMNSNINKLNVE